MAVATGSKCPASQIKRLQATTAALGQRIYKQIEITTTCQAKSKKTGLPCRAAPVIGSNFCFTHDPARAAQRAKAHSAGGRARHGRKLGSAPQPGQRVKVKTVADVVKLLESEINQVLTLEKSLSRAGTIARLALAFVKCFEVGEFTARLEALESALGAKSE